MGGRACGYVHGWNRVPRRGSGNQQRRAHAHRLCDFEATETRDHYHVHDRKRDLRGLRLHLGLLLCPADSGLFEQLDAQAEAALRHQLYRGADQRGADAGLPDCPYHTGLEKVEDDSQGGEELPGGDAGEQYGG